MNKSNKSKYIEQLVKKGKQQGFLSQEDILEIFPTIEEDIVLLDDIFKELQRKGNEKKINYIKRKSYYVSDKKFMEEYIDSIKGLDILDKKLEDITSESE